MTSSESLPLPMRKRESKRGRRCRMVSATFRPAERASSVSSARESSALTRLVPVTPMRMARSRLFPAPADARRENSASREAMRASKSRLRAPTWRALMTAQLWPSTGWGRRWAISMAPGWPPADAEGGHGVQAQQGQVHEVVMAQGA